MAPLDTKKLTYKKNNNKKTAQFTMKKCFFPPKDGWKVFGEKNPIMFPVVAKAIKQQLMFCVSVSLEVVTPSGQMGH